MASTSLERRVKLLEEHVVRLQNQVQSAKVEKDWRKTIGAFTDDEGMKGLLKEAMRLREEDRKKGQDSHRRSRSEDCRLGDR